VSAPDPQHRIAHLEHELQSTTRELQWAQLKIQVLEERLRQQRIRLLGPGSETLSDLQLQLLADEEPGVTAEEIEAEARREPVALETKPERKPHPGRERLPEHLPRVEKVIRCSEQQCQACGRETAVIGYDESEQLDVEPARYFVRVIKREKRACRNCKAGPVAMAVRELRIIDKGMASNRIVVAAVISKYCDHVPLYRQAAILGRESGLAISRATLDGWVMRVGELLRPIVEAMRRDLLQTKYLQADETTVPVQMHDRRGQNHQAYLWQYGQPGGELVFEFCMGRERAGPQRFLGKWEGILQTDGYRAYEGIGGSAMVHVGCWAHARRKFVDAVKVSRDDADAVKMTVRMDALFTVDREARRLAVSNEQRMAMRREHALPWLREIREECLSLSKQVLPQSALGKAVAYTLNMWQKLARCLEYGHVELSNNLAENSMRPVALGRKNWIHVGSPNAGPKVAAILRSLSLADGYGYLLPNTSRTSCPVSTTST